MANVAGNTALITAAWYSKAEVAQVLLAGGADVNTGAADGSTTLIAAAGSGHELAV